MTANDSLSLLNNLQTVLNAPSLEYQEKVQSLWSGYGQIIRIYHPDIAQRFIVKHILKAKPGNHPRGWNTSTSHQRKLKSYLVETSFYQDYAHKTDLFCKVPNIVAKDESDDAIVLVLEDLNDAGFTQKYDRADWATLKIAIRWLAYFHARFMHITTNESLWEIGTYWHLATRQDELLSMPESEYKKRAVDIHLALNNAKFKTLVHGDAKLENLCFHEHKNDVAAVDFQYVGFGSGVKDLMYLVGSAFDASHLAQFDSQVVDVYLQELEYALIHYKKSIDFSALEEEVRTLYPVAWADFYRFLLGWNPKSWKVNDYMKTQAERGLNVICR